MAGYLAGWVCILFDNVSSHSLLKGEVSGANRGMVAVPSSSVPTTVGVFVVQKMNNIKKVIITNNSGLW